MSTGRFDERCPHCKTGLEMDWHLALNENADQFEMECPHCKEQIVVDVQWRPEFELSKPSEVSSLEPGA